MPDSGGSKRTRRAVEGRSAPKSDRLRNRLELAANAEFLQRIDGARKRRVWPSFMENTNGGGSLERVQGFAVDRAMTSGFRSGRLTEAAFVGYAPQINSGVGFADLTERPGAAKRENVIGADDRVRVLTTANVPWRAMCQLVVKYNDGRVGAGTGWFAGPRTIITAGHVLEDVTQRRTPVHIQVIPGRNGPEAPFGFHVAKRYAVSPGWRSKADAEADFGAVFLDGETKQMVNAADGNTLGYFGFKEITDQESVKMLVNTAGYPVEPNKEFGTLWYNAGRIVEALPRFLTYMIDTEGGQSGSPIFHYNDTTHERLAVAIHTTGWYPNRGVRIAGAVFDLLLEWVAHPVVARLP